jgi:hypothetical protein
MRRIPFTPPPGAPAELRDLLAASRAMPLEEGPRMAVLDWCEANPDHVSAAIGEVMAAEPDLTLCGLGVDHNRLRDTREVREHLFAVSRARLASPAAHRQFALALCWLVTRAPRTGFNTRESAYQMKHYAERFMLDGYVANGALVAAALFLGIPVKRADREPHAFLKVSSAMVGERERRRAEKSARREAYYRRCEDNRRKRCGLPPLPPISQ